MHKIINFSRFVGNYGFAPGLGWRRTYTLDCATWNYQLSRAGRHA